MPPPPPPQKAALIAVVAGTVVGVTALTYGLTLLRRHRHDHPHAHLHSNKSSGCAVVVESWSAQQVATWLLENGARPPAVDICLRFNVEGDTLLRVTAQDLYRMGVPLRDARVILAAVEDLRETQHLLLSRASSPPATAVSRQVSAVRAPARAITASVSAASAEERFEAAWRALERTCVLPAGHCVAAEQQQRVVVYTSALLECFQALSATEQAAALTLVAAAEDSPMPTPTHRAPVAASVPPVAPHPPNPFLELEKKLQPLNDMLDGFLGLLESPQLATVSPADFAEIGERVEGQVRRVEQVCEQLPPELVEALLRKCARVFEILARHRHVVAEGSDAAATVKSPTPSKAAAVVANAPSRAAGAAAASGRQAVMQALYEVMTRLKDPAVRDLPPRERVAVLVTLAERAEGIAELASGAVPGVAADEQVLQVAQPLLQLIQEAVRVSAVEAEVTATVPAAKPSQAPPTPAAAVEAAREEEEEAAKENDEGMTSADIPVIVETIQKIQSTLQSSEFQHAAPQVRAQLCAVLSQRVSALESRTADLPSPLQGTVQELLRNTKGVLMAVGSSSAAVAAAAERRRGAGEDTEEAAQEEEEAEDEAETEEDEKEKEREAAEDQPQDREDAEANGAKTPVDVERGVEQLEKIFEFLTSEALEQAPAEERKAMASALMERVSKIKTELHGTAVEGSIVSELIDPLYALLESMANTPEPSKQFLEITAPLRDVQQLLSSDTFRTIPQADKMRMARSLVPQLQQITSTFASLPAAEKAAAEELVRPISEELLRVVRQRADESNTVTAQRVLDRLQTIMRTIQGGEFTTMTAAARTAWAAKTADELQQLNSNCAALGQEGEVLRPIVQQLEQQLRALSAVGDDAAANGGRRGSAKPRITVLSREPPGPTPNEEVEGAKDESDVWAAVRAMSAELVRARQEKVNVPPRRLQAMLDVLAGAADEEDMSTEQEKALEKFGEVLRQQVEGDESAEAAEDGHKEEVDGQEDVEDERETQAVAADDGDDDDALDSLRVSLRTLLDVAQSDGGGATGAELSAIAAKTEELIAAADEANVAWRDDTDCSRLVQGIVEVLQGGRARAETTSGTPASAGAGAGAGVGVGAAAAAPSRVELVLRSSLEALTQHPPTRKEDFAPYMRVLQLAQPAAEQMTNRELLLLKTLQESVIESMRRLPDVAQATAAGGEEGGEQEVGAEKREEGDEVDAVLDALLEMSLKLRDRSYSAKELDEFEGIQRSLESILARAGVDATDAMNSVREQIRLQRKAVKNAEQSNHAEVIEGESQESSNASVTPANDTADAFNEDDEDDTGSNGAPLPPSELALQESAAEEEEEGKEKPEDVRVEGESEEKKEAAAAAAAVTDTVA